MNSRIFLLLLSLVWGIGVRAQQGMTLQDAINYALQNNTEVRNGQIDIADAQAQVIETRAIGIPKVDLGVDYNYFLDIPTQILPDFISPAVYGVLFQEGIIPPKQIAGDKTAAVQFGQKHNLGVSLSANTLIFDGSYIIGLRASKLYAAFAEQKYQNTKIEIKNKVRDAYLPVLLINENLIILEKNIKNLEQLLFEVKETYKEGFVEQLDVDKLELSLSNLKIEKENLKRQEEIVLNYLKMVMGYPIEQEVKVTDDIDAIFEEATEEDLALAVDYHRRQAYTLAEMNIKLQKLNIDRFRTAYLPQLVAFGSYKKTLQANTKDDASWYPTSVIGAQLKWNLFGGWGRKAKVQRARLQQEKAFNAKKELERGITLEVRNTRMAYLNAEKKLQERKKNLELAEKIYDVTKIKYKEGVGTSVELSQAEQALYRSQQNKTQALYDLLVAKINLDKALGK